MASSRDSRRERLVDALARELRRQADEGARSGRWDRLMFRRFPRSEGTHLAILDGTVNLRELASALERALSKEDGPLDSE